MAGWKARILSQAGKTVLIKLNLAGIILFTMQGVKIPNYIATEIDRANMYFFWKNNLDPDTRVSPIPLISWDRICRPKRAKSLGVRKTQDVNAICF